MRRLSIIFPLYLFIIVLCLQNHVTFVETKEVEEPSPFTIEFRTTATEDEQGQLEGLSLPAGKYSLRKKSPYILSFRPKEAYWVARSNQIQAINKDVSSTTIARTKGNRWVISIVFNKKFSRQLVNICEKNKGKEVAILINGDLITVPLLNQGLSQYLNKQGEYPLILPTTFRTQSDAQEFMSHYNLTIGS